MVVGEMDDNVPPESTYRFVDALIKAQKDFELLVVPGGGHGAGGGIRPAAIAGLLRAASSRDRTAEPKRGGPSWQLTSPSSVLANLPEPVAPIDVSVIGHDFIDQIV